MDIDSLIERLEWEDGEWLGSVNLPDLGSNVEIVIISDNNKGPDNLQRFQLKWFCENISKIFPLIESELHKYYMSTLPFYHEGLGEYSNQLMPPLDKDKEIWNYITDPGILIFPSEERLELHLEFECTFDVNNGVRVVFENDKLLRVGIN